MFGDEALEHAADDARGMQHLVLMKGVDWNRFSHAKFIILDADCDQPCAAASYQRHHVAAITNAF